MSFFFILCKMKIKSFLIKQDILIFATIYIFLFIVAIIFLTIPDFDFLNYQAYNCYSLLNNRFSQDFLAANTRTCINPLLYLPEYILMFKLNNHPYIFILISILDSVIVLFLIYKIVFLTFKKTSKLRGITAAFCILYVAFSPVMMNVLDFSRGDCKVAVFCLLSLYLILKNIFLQDSKKRSLQILLAGIFIGIAIGLKITAAVYFICIFFILLIYSFAKKIQKPLKMFILLVLPVFLCFLLLNGHWFYLCWKHYHNPIFPYYNNFFQSEYADFEKFMNADYGQLAPVNWQEFVFYPFFNAKEENFVHFFGIEDYIWDSRYAINYIVNVCIFIYSIFVNLFSKKNRLFKETNKNLFIFLAFFTILVYFVNLYLFGTYRYIVSSSVLYGITLSACILTLFSKLQNKILHKYIVSCIYVVILVFVYKFSSYGIYPPQNYVNYENKELNMKNITKVFEYEDLHFEDNSTVILHNEPTSYIAINQNENVSYIGVSYEYDGMLDLGNDESKKYLANRIDKILKSNQKVYYAQGDGMEDGNNEILENWERRYSRKLSNCREVNTKFFHKRAWWRSRLCEFNKI